MRADGGPANEKTGRMSGNAATTHGRHCPCSACAAEDWAKIDAPCGIHGAECPDRYPDHVREKQSAANVYVDDERVARVMQTTGCGEIEARFMLDLHDGKVDGDVLDERGDDA